MVHGFASFPSFFLSAFRMVQEGCRLGVPFGACGADPVHKARRGVAGQGGGVSPFSHRQGVVRDQRSDPLWPFPVPVAPCSTGGIALDREERLRQTAGWQPGMLYPNNQAYSMSCPSLVPVLQQLASVPVPRCTVASAQDRGWGRGLGDEEQSGAPHTAPSFVYQAPSYTVAEALGGRLCFQVRLPSAPVRQLSTDDTASKGLEQVQRPSNEGRQATARPPPDWSTRP